MANVWPATQSQLYGELNKLADVGLDQSVGGRPARPQGVSRSPDAGRAELLPLD